MPVGVIDTVGGDLPLPVGGGVAVSVPPSDVDVTVEYVPLWLSIGEESPYERATAPYQRDQVDQQPEAGEQSLAGWWTRSQMSFHFGAGLEWLDSIHNPQPEDRLRFAASRNVDVWTPGRVARLPATALERAASAGEQVWLAPGDGDLLVMARDSAVEVYDGTSWTARDHGSTFSIRALATDGINFYVATLDGVWWAPIAGSATATKLWELPSEDVPMCLGWVKQRLMLGHGADVYELGGTGPALPTAQYTHPVTDWSWTAFTETPDGILACGYAGASSGAVKFTLTDQAVAPVLGAGIPALTMPAGEQIRSALFYLGSLLVLGTSHGVRVCQFDNFSATIQLGPLSVEAEAPVGALTGFDTYVWAGSAVAGETCLLRLDLSAPLGGAGHYAWAPDLVMPEYGTWTEPVTSIVALPDGRKAVGVQARGVVLEQADTDPAEAAWLQTARIRMGTVEDKHWVYGTLRGTYGVIAPVGVSIQQPGDDEFTSVYVTGDSTGRFSLRARSAEWLALRFDLAEGAEISSYQAQALPGGKRQRLISLPVTVTDFQTTRSGIAVGAPGWARERLAALEQLEAAGAPVTVSAPALFPEAVLGVIERLSYTQLFDPGDQGNGTGGVLQVVLRVIS